jgi:hypothetical protein
MLKTIGERKCLDGAKRKLSDGRGAYGKIEDRKQRNEICRDWFIVYV